jgi:hypothetical protein
MRKLLLGHRTLEGLFDPRVIAIFDKRVGRRNDSRLRYFMVKLLRVDGGCLGAEKR